MGVEMTFVVAIDGPAGAGKSSVAKTVADRTGFVFVDTGAIYRTLALAAEEQQVSPDDGPALAQLTEKMKVAFQIVNDENRVMLNGRDISEAIRKPHMGVAASKVSRHGEVRDALLGLQRRLGSAPPGAVLEGRDIGSVVFPNATLKFYLTASANERARRRTQELKDKGMDADFDCILYDIQRRDQEDSNRAVAPLVQAQDAVLIDSSSLAKEDVIRQIVDAVRDHEDYTSSTEMR